MAIHSRRLAAADVHRRTRPRQTDEELRQFIARELHDRISQTLTTMLVDLELFRREQSGRRSVIDKVEGIEVDIRKVLSSMRELLHDLRGESRQLSEAFTEAMASLLLDFQRQTGIEGRLTIDAGWPPRLRPAAAANLGGIVCEALANVRRHSEATHVTVTLQPRGDSGVAIAITDDGRGLEPTVAAKPGLGIAGMRERALLLGAVLLIESQERIGTTISVVVPDAVVPVPLQPQARPARPAGELTR